MHELGIIVHVAKTLKHVALQENVSKIGSVTLEIGEASGIVESYLTDCWEYYRKKDELIENSKLIIEKIEAVTYCDDCEKTYPTVQYGRQCPYCKGYNTWLAVGNECKAGLQSIRRGAYVISCLRRKCSLSMGSNDFSPCRTYTFK